MKTRPASTHPTATGPAHPAAVPPPTCDRVVSTGRVLLDNLPTAALFVLGAWLMRPLGRAAPVLYLLGCAGSIVWFWARICTACGHYGTRACPCGYGVIAARFFKPHPTRDFHRRFRRNLPVMFPWWFAPPAVAIYELWHGAPRISVVPLAVFCVLGFVVIPLISRRLGCADCALKDQCPWMQLGRSRPCASG